MLPKKEAATIPVNINWQNIDTVLLDMDGTLLDKHFDDYFWHYYVPETYGMKEGLDIGSARTKLQRKYKRREGSLAWADLDFWSRELGLDIPALKIEVDHLIQVHPYVIDFLKFCKDNNKLLCLVTNAHAKTLKIKLNRTAISGYFDHMVCAEDVGVAKEDPSFWGKLEGMLGFERSRTIMVDDTEKVLISAQSYGFTALIFVARPSSVTPVQYSTIFPSIVYFKELM